MKTAKRKPLYVNYETHLIWRSLVTDERRFNYWKAAAQEAKTKAAEYRGFKDGKCSIEEAPLWILTDRLQEELDGDSPDLAPDVIEDLSYMGYDYPAWNAIAEELLENDAERTELVDQEKFTCGNIVVTPGALEVLEPEDFTTALERHVAGDWGECGPEDREENEFSLREGCRLFSVYLSRKGIRFWVITEADRSTTTVLLPSEY